MIISIVTGASSGIGEAIYKRLRQHSISLEDGKAPDPVVGISRRGPDLRANLNADYEVLQIPQQLADTYGRDFKVRHLVNCAGMLSLEEEYPERPGWLNTVLSTMELNFWAPYFLIQKLKDRMIDGESTISNISSISAIRPEYDLPVYSASKAALSAMSRSLALALAPRKIRVNTIAPGFFRTNLVPGEAPQHLLDKIPLMHSEAEVEEIIPAFDAILNSSYMTGTEIVVDGGLQWAK